MAEPARCQVLEAWLPGVCGVGASAWEGQGPEGAVVSELLQDRCLACGSWETQLRFGAAGTKRGRCVCMGRESNPGLPRGRREFYH